MTIRLSTTKNLDGTEATALTVHRTSVGSDHSLVASSPRIVATGLEVETLNNEKSIAIGGSAANEFVPQYLIAHMEDVGVGAAANGDMHITVGTASGGTQILPDTTLTNLISLNDHFVIDLTGLTTTIPADSTIYVKNIQADSTAGAAHLADFYIVGEVFVSGT